MQRESAVSSPSGARGGALATNAFWHILSIASESGDNKFGSYFTIHYASENDNAHVN